MNCFLQLHVLTILFIFNEWHVNFNMQISYFCMMITLIKKFNTFKRYNRQKNTEYIRIKWLNNNLKEYISPNNKKIKTNGIAIVKTS